MVEFSEALSAAGDALDTLATKAKALHYAATGDEDVNIADQAYNFATVAGPRGLLRAQAKGDANELVYLQRGITGVTKDVTDALEDDVIERFVTMGLGALLVGPFGLIAGVAPEEAFEDARAAAQGVVVPSGGAPQNWPWYVWGGGGAVAGGLAALTMTGSPRVALVGAGGGAALGLLARHALGAIASKLTIG